jgi:NitT/TauT family transport system ATP-binding protein
MTTEVFQSDALLPWRTVSQNVELGLEYKRVPRKERRDISRYWLDRVGLSEFRSSYPGELSGGMRQRASIARALAVDPDVLFLDEPFGALDALTRLKMQNDLIHLWEGSGKTVLMITHDIDEAIILSDRILVFSNRPGAIIGDDKVSISRHERGAGGRHHKLKMKLMKLLNVETMYDMAQTRTESA